MFLVSLFIRYKIQSWWKIIYVQLKKIFKKDIYWPNLMSFTDRFFFFSRTLSSIWMVYRSEFSRVLRKSNSFISVPQILPSYYCQKASSWGWFGQRPSVIKATAGKVKRLIITFIFQMPSSLNGWLNMDTGCQGWLWSLCRQMKEIKEMSLFM